MSSTETYAEKLYREERRHLQELGTTIKVYIGAEAEALRDADIKQKRALKERLLDSVKLTSKGYPKDLSFFEQFCHDTYDAPLNQELQQPRDLSGLYYELKQIVLANDYPKSSRSRIAKAVSDMMHNARMDNHDSTQSGMFIHSLLVANQRAK